jgi:predicted negative regulator of RcsB-dependent stress response
MIKFVVVVLVLAVGGWFGWLYLHPEKRACARLVTDLCHKSSSPDEDRAKCEALFKEVRDKAGDDAASSSAKCIAESSSCAGAAGCLAGATAKAGAGLFGEFLKGAEKAFSGDK